MTTEHPQLAVLIGKLTSLEQMLVDNDPKMPVHLREIHKSLIQFEELSHLLSEEQIAVIIEAQSKKVGVVLQAETTKKKTSGKVTADQL